MVSFIEMIARHLIRDFFFFFHTPNSHLNMVAQKGFGGIQFYTISKVSKLRLYNSRFIQ